MRIFTFTWQLWQALDAVFGAYDLPKVDKSTVDSSSVIGNRKLIRELNLNVFIPQHSRLGCIEDVLSLTSAKTTSLLPPKSSCCFLHDAN